MMKTAMIWGAAGGIGRALVDELASKEWRVVSLSRHDEEMSKLESHSFYVDVNDPFSVRTAVHSVALEVSNVDLWVYTVGDITSVSLEEMKPETWNRILSANLTGAYLAAHFSLPLLAKDAHLVFVGAISERLRLPGLSAYAASKAGIEAMAEVLRKEQRNRRVTVVRPAAVDTPLWEKVPLRMPNGSPSASKISARILSAYDDGHSGFLDLVPGEH